MGIESILLTHAEVAIALAGFASVAAVLQRPLSPVQRQRFLVILFSALFLVLGSLLPVWLSAIELVGPELWSTATAILLVLYLTGALFLIYLPLRRLGLRSFMVINLPVTILGWGITVAAFVLLGLNFLVVPTPGFGLYYASLLASLCGVFIAFADVVVSGGD